VNISGGAGAGYFLPIYGGKEPPPVLLFPGDLQHHCAGGEWMGYFESKGVGSIPTAALRSSSLARAFGVKARSGNSPARNPNRGYGLFFEP